MKAKRLFTLIAVLAIASCTQEQLEPAQPQMPEVLLEKMKTHTVIDANNVTILDTSNDDQIKCLAGTCSSVVTQFRQQYQQMANTTCKIIWGDLTCCLNGYKVSVIVLVHPQSSNCIRYQQAYIYAVAVD